MGFTIKKSCKTKSHKIKIIKDRIKLIIKLEKKYDANSLVL